MIDLATLNVAASRQLLADPRALPVGPGVYLVFFDSRRGLLERSGYLEFDVQRPVAVGGFDLLYVGATNDSVRGRVIAHLRGNSRASSLRMTLGALLAEELSLAPVGDATRTYFDFGDGEQRLSDWLCANTRIAFCACDAPFAFERYLLERFAVPLNIANRKRHPYSKYLMALRAYFAARPTGAASAIGSSLKTLSARSRVDAMCVNVQPTVT